MITFIRSGFPALDAMLGGGFPRGRITELFGPEGSGKSAVAIRAIASVQRSGGVTAVVDSEPDAMLPGCPANLVMLRPSALGVFAAIESLEQAMLTIDLLVVTGPLSPPNELPSYGEARARQVSEAVRRLATQCCKTHTAVLFVTELRYKIGEVFANHQAPPGSTALKFYAGVRLHARRVENDRAHVTVVKSKCVPSATFSSVEFDLREGRES
jgi:recombination protein RecA